MSEVGKRKSEIKMLEGWEAGRLERYGAGMVFRLQYLFHHSARSALWAFTFIL